MPVNDAPFALFITWTCFGNWLPGDERGYVSNLLLPEVVRSARRTSPGRRNRKDDPLTRPSDADPHEAAPDAVVRSARARHSGVAGRGGAEAGRADPPAARSWPITSTSSSPTARNDGSGVRKILKGTSQADLSDKAGENNAGGRGEEAIVPAHGRCDPRGNSVRRGAGVYPGGDHRHARLSSRSAGSAFERCTLA